MSVILVVEDNQTNMQLVRFLLELGKHEILEARDAAECLAVIAERMPDLILMDIQLPDVDGLELTRRLRTDRRLDGIRIIAVTAFAMRGDEARIRAAGCDGYVTKPIRYEPFLAAVDAALASRTTPTT